MTPTEQGTSTGKPQAMTPTEQGTGNNTLPTDGRYHMN